MGATAEQRRDFGHALTTRVTTKAERAALAEVVGVGDEAVRTWTTGDRVPEPDMVFRVEEALHLKPGTLSRHLGYVPVNTKAVLTVREAISADPRLTADGRRHLLALYDSAVRDGDL